MDANDRRQGCDRKTAGETDAPGIFRRGVRFLMGPDGIIPQREIREGGTLIRSLVEDIRFQRATRRRIRLNEHGSFDLQAMAFDAALPVQEIERRLANRQIVTARNTKLYLGLGSILLVFWGIEILNRGALVGTALNTVLFLAVIACLFLSAFANAFINWQVRTRRLGRVGEFISLEGSWWPHERYDSD